MMKTKLKDVDFLCGHTGRVSVHGSAEDVQRQLRAAESANCPDCVIAENAIEGFPLLIGTERQVAWGLAIRKKAITRFEELPAGEQRESLLEKAKQETTAEWWITQRGYFNKTLADLVRPFLN